MATLPPGTPTGTPPGTPRTPRTTGKGVKRVRDSPETPPGTPMPYGTPTTPPPLQQDIANGGMYFGVQIHPINFSPEDPNKTPNQGIFTYTPDAPRGDKNKFHQEEEENNSPGKENNPYKKLTFEKS